MKPVEKKAAETAHSDSLYFASAALARQIEKIAKKAWKPSGLHPSHAHLLSLILEDTYMEGVSMDGISYPGFLSKELLLSPSTITRLLKKLEKMGLVTRSPYENLMVIQPTDKAKELKSILDQCGYEFALHCSKLLGDREMSHLTDALNESTDLLAKRVARTS